MGEITDWNELTVGAAQAANGGAPAGENGAYNTNGIQTYAVNDQNAPSGPPLQVVQTIGADQPARGSTQPDAQLAAIADGDTGPSVFAGPGTQVALDSRGFKLPGTATDVPTGPNLPSPENPGQITSDLNGLTQVVKDVGVVINLVSGLTTPENSIATPSWTIGDQTYTYNTDGFSLTVNGPNGDTSTVQLLTQPSSNPANGQIGIANPTRYSDADYLQFLTYKANGGTLSSIDDFVGYGYPNPGQEPLVLAAPNGVAPSTLTFPQVELSGGGYDPIAVQRAQQLAVNKAAGDAFEIQVAQTLDANNYFQGGYTQQVIVYPYLDTSQSQVGPAVRVDFLGLDSNNVASGFEAKAGDTAPDTANQAQGYPNIAQYGGVIGGNGGGLFQVGDILPPGTLIIKVTPSTQNLLQPPNPLTQP